jgi:hypothetical protein
MNSVEVLTPVPPTTVFLRKPVFNGPTEEIYGVQNDVFASEIKAYGGHGGF